MRRFLSARLSARRLCTTAAPQHYGRAAVLDLLNRVADGSVTPDQASERMRSVFDENVKGGEAHVDHQRALRTGLPEVVFGEGKTPEQIAEISKALARHSEEAIVTTRVTEEVPFCSVGVHA